MPLCSKCNQVISWTSPEAANDNIAPIYVLRDHELQRREYVQSLARYVVSLPISSRDVPNWMADSIYQFAGAILWPDDRPFEIGDTDIDDVFNNDGSFRWIREFRHRAYVSFKQIPQARIIPRYRLIDLSMRIDIRNLQQKSR